jgi:hypothetical protein
MKNLKYHRKPMLHKIKHYISTKFKKACMKRTRNYIESEESNRKWEDYVMSRNMISTPAVSRLTTISANRKEILNQERDSSQAIAQLITGFNILSIEFEIRDK